MFKNQHGNINSIYSFIKGERRARAKQPVEMHKDYIENNKYKKTENKVSR
jgi:rRNA processing protein Gar1